jgi:DNA-binding winged helix-turn-helix (wHTH) protein/predicted ATPase
LQGNQYKDACESAVHGLMELQTNMDETSRSPGFWLDLDDERLWRNGQAVALTPKTFALLRYLLERRNRLVTKEALLKGVWPGTYVVESEVKHYVAELRKALGDDANAPQFIETVRGRGYRFIGQVAVVHSRSGQRETRQERDYESLSARGDSREPCGREAELGQLRRRLDQALSGERQICFVVGEPGIGKTTLVDAFLESAGAVKGAWIARGQCLERYGTEEPYRPVLEAFETLCARGEAKRVKELLTQFAPLAIVQMAGLVEQAELEFLERRVQGATRERMLRELTQFIEALTAEQGLILAIEDLHWADESTWGLVNYLAQRRQRDRLLFLGTSRFTETPGSNRPAPLYAELQAKALCTVVELPSLSEAAIAEHLRREFPSAGDLPLELVRVIHRRTNGNPLFMARILEHAVAQGWLAEIDGQWALKASLQTLESEIPANVRQLIEQRLASLDEQEQRLLETCSVAGLTFSPENTAAALNQDEEAIEGHCEALGRRKLFIRRRTPANSAGRALSAQYEFFHVLCHQTIYERIPPLRRARLHQLIGERLEQQCSKTTQAAAAELAFHYEQACDLPRAARYLHEAADHALRLGSASEAAVIARKGIALLSALPENLGRKQQEIALLIRLGAALTAVKGYGAAEVEQTYLRSRELCREMGDPPELFPVLRGLAAFYVGRAKYETARQLGEQLLALAGQTGEDAHYLEAHLSLGATYYFVGDFGAAVAHLEQVIARYDPSRHHVHAALYGQDPSVLALGFKAAALWFLGHASQALDADRLALARSQELGHRFSRALAFCMSAYLHLMRREAQEVKQQAEATLALASEHGFAYLAAEAVIYRGWALTEQGRMEEGIAMMREGLTAFEATGAVAGKTAYLAIMAQGFVRCGRNEEAMETLKSAFAVADNVGEHLVAAELHRLKGELLSRLGRGRAASASEACFRRALDAASRQSAQSLELRAATSLARFWRDRGKAREAFELLAPVYDSFAEGFDTLDLLEARDQVDRLKKLTELRQ